MVEIFGNVYFLQLAQYFNEWINQIESSSASTKGSHWNVLAFTQNREPNRNRIKISRNNSAIEEEIDFYLNRATQASHENVNVLDYWKTNRDKMPHLASLSREIFCVPTTSASSERCFSAGGNVITDARTLLDSDRAEELIFCKQNYFALEPLIKSWKLDEEEFTSDSDDSISSLSDCPDNPGNCYINFLNLIFKKDIYIICTNGNESTVNRALGGSTYPG